jgi:hypothetical protein
MKSIFIKGSNKELPVKKLPLFMPPHLDPLPLKGERAGKCQEENVTQ